VALVVEVAARVFSHPKVHPSLWMA
jgi:hypothetical protein